jgi:hypothetical protein
MDIENLSVRFANREIQLFLDHPELLLYCEASEFENRDFFEKLCHIKGNVFDGFYSVEIAILYNHTGCLDRIPDIRMFTIDRCEGHRFLDEDSLMYLLNNSSGEEDPEYLLTLAFEKGFTKLIDFYLSFDIEDYYEDKSIKYFKANIVSMHKETYLHLINNYPDYPGLWYVSVKFGYRPLPPLITNSDIENLYKTRLITEKQRKTFEKSKEELRNFYS